MATWGTRIVGLEIPVKESDELIAGKTYEANFSSPVYVPETLEMPLITELCKLRDKVAGSETTYVYVKGRDVTVQWKQKTASPISAGVVVVALLALAILVLAVSLALVSLSRVEGTSATGLLGGSTILIIIIVILALVLIPRLFPKR